MTSACIALDAPGREFDPDAATPLRFGPILWLRKEEIFQICAALALAEAVLTSLDRHTEAAYLASVFDIAEGSL